MPLNIQIVKENMSHSSITDAYAEHDVTIHVNSKLTPRLQADCVIHEVIESYLSPMVPHDSIDELTNLITSALDDVIKWDDVESQEPGV